MEAILRLDVVKVEKALFESVFLEDQEYKLQDNMEIKIKFNEIYGISNWFKMRHFKNKRKRK